MKKTILLCTLVAIVAFVAGLKVGQPNDLQAAEPKTGLTLEQKWAIEEYQMRTDNLIQAIDCDWESFGDVTMETDEWDAYCVAEEEVLKLINEWD